MQAVFQQAAADIFAQMGEAAVYESESEGTSHPVRVVIYRDVQPEPDALTVQLREPHTEADLLVSELPAEPRKGDTFLLTDEAKVWTVQAKPIRNDGYVYRVVVK